MILSCDCIKWITNIQRSLGSNDLYQNRIPWLCWYLPIIWQVYRFTIKIWPWVTQWVCSEQVLNYNVRRFYLPPSWSSGKRVWLKRDGCGSIPTCGNALYFLIFSFLRSGTKAKVRRWVPPLNTQCLEKFGGMSYHSAYPPCMRDTAWIWFLIWIYLNKRV